MKIIKLEQIRNEYGYVGQLTGRVYYTGTRYSCTWWQKQYNRDYGDNRSYMEAEEKEYAERLQAEKETMNEAYNNSMR